VIYLFRHVVTVFPFFHRCFQAAINCARYVKHVVLKALVLPVLSMPSNRYSMDSAGRRELFVTWKSVTKVYLLMDDDERDRIISFYKDTKGVPFLERITGMEVKKKTELHLHLEPVGLERMPREVGEAKVIHMHLLNVLPSS
jgi:hypothetical protein